MIGVLALLLALPASASSFAPEPLDWTHPNIKGDQKLLRVIKMTESMKEGDLKRMLAARKLAAKEGLIIVGLELTSTGGDADTGLELAKWVKKNSAVVVLESFCWSACSYAALVALGNDTLIIGTKRQHWRA